ncbi:fungal-specific transcription factor domain-containing protein [Aspergillus keveii]|uniref:Fungal-specific transcription factor domain-containing protein n=1 Tax=Aspergillus keveii TaxID=714993 RepID=A0ABR4FX00_9EURO
MVNLPQISGYRRIKRAARACQRCHARKVRCDATVTGYPCTNCRLDSSPCQAFAGGRERRKQLALARARATASEGLKSVTHCAGRSSSEKRRSSTVQLPVSSYQFIQPLEIGKHNLDRLPLLKQAGCLILPDKLDLDVLVRHYFLYVHPFCPLLDEAVFWRAYKRTRDGAKQIPLLLLRAMMFSASCFVPAAVATRCGYDSLLDARDDLYTKAKALYDSGLEKNPLTISRAALLLTFYSSDFDVYANSEWLCIAIREARVTQAKHVHSEELMSDADQTDFRRLWWSCLIRDRTLALGMRRPLQITAADPYPPMLTADDVSDEIFGSVVYTYEVKSALFELLTSLCHFATAVTELASIAFPPSCHAISSIEDPCGELEKLGSAKSALLLWELDWISYMEGKNSSLHPSIPLFSSLLSIHYQSARVALCNRTCFVLNEINDYRTRYFHQLQLCRSELIAAVASVAAHVRQLMVIEAVDKLPISIAAYTTTPYILLSINSQSNAKQSQDLLVLFTAVNRALGTRYHLTRVSNLTSRALWLSKLLKDSSEEEVFDIPRQTNLFTLSLQQYTRLLQYIDGSMSIPRDSAQETEVLYAAASFIPRELSVYATEEPVNDELTPVWLEAMGNFFFGPGNGLALSLCESPRKEDVDTPICAQLDCDDSFSRSLQLPWVLDTGLELLET